MRKGRGAEDIGGFYFTPSMYESFLHASLSLAFHSNRSAPCSSFKDCRSIPNGYCIQGACYASNAYYHNAMDPGLRRGLRVAV